MAKVYFTGFVCALAASVAMATASPSIAQTPESKLRFQVAAMGLSEALQDFAKRHNINIVYAEDLVRGRRSAPVDGEFSIPDALRALLAGSGLTYRINADGTYLIVQVRASAEDPNQRATDAPPAAATPPAPVDGQTPAQADSDGGVSAEPIDERVTVLGTRLGRQFRKISPTSTIARDTIDRLGAASVGDALSRLTTASPGLVDGRTFDVQSGTIGQSSVGTRGIGLRGLGVGSTLVLLNGRRVASYGYASGNNSSFVDLDSLPFMAIERIDILKTGGAALYGSEALAGVINVVMKDEIEGLSLRASGSITELGDNDTAALAGAYGVGSLDDDGYNVFVSADYRSSGPIALSDRRQTETADLRSIGLFDNRAPTSEFVNFIRFSTFTFGTLFPCPPDRVRAEGLCGTNLNQYLDAVPAQDNLNLFSRASARFGDLETYAELGYGVSNTTFRMPPAILDVRLFGPGWPFSDPPVRYDLGGEVIALLDRGYLATRYGQRMIDITSKNLRALTGATYFVDDWKIDGGLLFSKGDATQEGKNFIRTLEFLDSLESAAPFVYASPTTPVSAADRARFAPGFQNESESRLFNANLVATGKLFENGPRPINVAIGADFRHESLTLNADPGVEEGQYIDLVSIASVRDERDVKSVFAEFGIPLTPELLIQVAARYDDYSKAAQATVTPEPTVTRKIGASYRPLDGVTVRASYEEGFRPPSLFETSLVARPGVFIAYVDPVRCPVTGSVFDCNFAPGLSGSNPDLVPEDSKNLSAGVVFDPLPGLTVSADVYEIVRKNEIVVPDPTFLLANESVFPDRVVRAAPDIIGLPGRVILLDQRFINIGETSVSGLDLGVNYSFPVWNGTLDLGAEASYTFEFSQIAFDGAPSIGSNGYLDRPKLIAQANATWSMDKFSASVFARRIGGYKLALNDADTCTLPATAARFCTVDSFTTVLTSVSYDVFPDIRATLSIDNLFDQEPPYDLAGNRIYNGGLHSVAGRTYQFRIGYRY